MLLLTGAVACGIDARGSEAEVRDAGPGGAPPIQGGPSDPGGPGDGGPTDGGFPPDDASTEAGADADLPDTGPVTAVLELTRSDPPANVDLTAEGTIDWAHFGGSGGGIATRKNITPNIISILDALSLTFGASTGFPATFDWTDGKSGTTPPTNTYFYGMSSATTRMTIKVPSGPTKRTFVVYVGGNQTRGRLTASFANAALAPKTDEFEDQNAGYGQKYTVGFATPTVTELVVDWRLVTAYGSDSIRFAGAALR
jgi:hypothetical protein